MTDETAQTARLMKVVDVIVAEQGVVEALSNLGFNPTPLAEAVIKAADGDVIDLDSRRDAR